MTEREPLLEVANLGIGFAMGSHTIPTIINLSLSVAPGETLGIVGESGSGKSLTARAIMGLLPVGARLSSGRILYYPRAGDPVDITGLPPRGKRIRALRAREIAMIFQEPMASLSPVHTIGDQIATTIAQHMAVSRRAARGQAVDWLKRVGMPSPEEVAHSYPHQISGGMRQRAMIAMALSCEPRLLICDEPTTALDVTTEAQIVELLDGLQADLGMGMIFISHNVALVSEVADRVVVMYLGEAVEKGTRSDVLGAPAHPYTAGLLNSIPSATPPGKRLETLSGSVPDPAFRPTGCGFYPRCPSCQPGHCDRIQPVHHAVSATQTAMCHLHG